MTVILFIAILVILIIVHETGHFIFAKRAGIRVDEFGLGYPPRIWGKKIGETVYSINWLPFGGFVKIFGEDLEDEARTGPQSARGFASKPKWVQALVLFAGILFNIIFAWLIISATYMAGTPASVDNGLGEVSNPHLEIVDVLQGSPAEKGGLKPGDDIMSLSIAGGQSGYSPMDPANNLAPNTPDEVTQFVVSHSNSQITVGYERGGKIANTAVTPVAGLDASGNKLIGVSLDNVGTLRLPFFQALWEGLKSAWGMIVAIVSGLAMLVGDALRGHSDLSQVAGPVGIAHLVGDARSLGFGYVVTFTAFISINLAVINLIPFPALDGGRILFVAIEAIRRKPISAKVAGTVNFIGFALLIALMLVVTFHDVWKLLVK